MMKTTGCFFIICLCFCAARAQGYKAEIVGRVTDSLGAAVSGARLTAANVETNIEATAVSGENGEFVIPQLVPGSYRITAEAQGFKRFVLPEIVLRINQTARADVRLEIGEISEQVTVSVEAPVIDSETSALGEVITNQEIVDIPLNGRNYLSLALLSPGVVPSAAGANPYNINGSRSDHVNYLVDGIANINRRGNEPVVTPSIDAIREFKIITGSFSAEYGRLSGGVISVALKSGTNDFHGSVYEFNRNDALDARGFFDSEPQNLRRDQFGATVSGPLKRDRTFFLFGYEGLRSRQTETRLTRVPTLAEREGTFASAVRNPFTGQAFPGNTITPSLISPVAQNLLAFFPLPNRSGLLNYTTALDTREDRDDFLAKINHNFGERDQLTAQFLFNDGRGENPFRSTALEGFGASRKHRKQLWSAGYTKVFSESVVNEARFGFTRDDFREISDNAGRNTSLEAGIAGTAEGYGLANIVIAGFPELGDATFLPDEWTDHEFAVSDTLGWTRGSHFLKFGGDFQHSRFTNLFAAFAGGQIAFSGAFSLNPFADFLLGLPVLTQRQVGTNRSRLSSTYLGFFIQDDWRVHPDLTLNLGLRYDVSRPPVERDDRWANFFPDRGRQIAAGTTEDLPRALVRTDYNNFSPRVGFAFRPFGDARTVIRGGYGIFHSFDLQFTQYQIMGASAFPFTRLELFQATAVGNPSLANPFPDRPGITPGALSPNGWDFENPTPYMQNWNLTFGRELLPGLGLEISYVGSKGTHLSSTANINQTIRTAGGVVVPFPGFGRILFQRLAANSSYNALQISVEKRFAGGLAFRSAFTWSKSIDNASFGAPARLPQNPNDLAAERGLSEFDRRRVWNSDFVYEIPFGRNRRFGGNLSGWADALFGGWQINGIIHLLDGRPFTPFASRANTQAGFAARPDRTGPGAIENPTVERWFDPGDFAVVPNNQFRFGNSGRNILIGPGAVNFDASVFKDFEMPWDAHRLQIRAEFFNLPNRANFGQPDARIDQPTAGAISSAASGRQIQIGLKYLF